MWSGRRGANRHGRIEKGRERAGGQVEESSGRERVRRGKDKEFFGLEGGEVVEGGFKVLPFSFDFGQKLGKNPLVDLW